MRFEYTYHTYNIDRAKRKRIIIVDVSKLNSFNDPVATDIFLGGI